MEGGLVNGTFDKEQSHKTTESKSYRLFESLRFSLKYGMFAFFSMLLVLVLVEVAENLLGTGSPKIFDQLDFATAGLGFLLMFLAKFFERISRNR